MYYPNLGEPAQGNIFQQSSSAYSQGQGALSRAADPRFTRYSMNMYLNPYTDLVTNRSLDRLWDQQSRDLNMVRGQAAGSSAYGGARQGLVEAELMDRYTQSAGDLAANEYRTGFNTALGAAQTDRGQTIAAGQGLLQAAPVGFGLGQRVLQQQQAAGEQQRSLAQSILDQAAGQYQGYVNYPQMALARALQGIQGNPLGAESTITGEQTQTTTQQPGGLSYMSLLSGVGSAALGNPAAPALLGK